MVLGMCRNRDEDQLQRSFKGDIGLGILIRSQNLFGLFLGSLMFFLVEVGYGVEEILEGDKGEQRRKKKNGEKEKIKQKKYAFLVQVRKEN